MRCGSRSTGDKELPTHEDFRTVELRAVIFTAGLSFRSGNALTVLLGGWRDRLTNVVFAADLPAGTPPEIPRIIIQSEDSRFKVQVGPARLDVFWSSQSPDDAPDLMNYLNWYCEVMERYLAALQGWATRLACIIKRIATDPAPARTLSHHFCRDAWLQEGGPIERPSDFELNSAKQYALNGRFDVNSWLRVKSALARGPAIGPQQPEGRSVILAEQDISTRDEPNEQQFTADQARQFFRIMPEQFDQTLRLYFPLGTQQ